MLIINLVMWNKLVCYLDYDIVEGGKEAFKSVKKNMFLNNSENFT